MALTSKAKLYRASVQHHYNLLRENWSKIYLTLSQSSSCFLVYFDGALPVKLLNSLRIQWLTKTLEQLGGERWDVCVHAGPWEARGRVSIWNSVDGYCKRLSLELQISQRRTWWHWRINSSFLWGDVSWAAGSFCHPKYWEHPLVSCTAAPWLMYRIFWGSGRLKKGDLNLRECCKADI